jgi:hypothetical protein
MTTDHNLCEKLHSKVWALSSYQFDSLPSNLPSDGVYFCFERKENVHGGLRIARIGSHTGKGNLAARLREHITVNKDRSIFRKHIGRALLNRDRDPFLADWNVDLTTRKARDKHAHRIDFEKQNAIELRVSDYLRTAFTFAVLPMSDCAQALNFEAAAIGSVSNCPQCKASSTWLGLSSPNSHIASSGLWQIRGLWGPGLTEGQLSAL